MRSRHCCDATTKPLVIARSIKVHDTFPDRSLAFRACNWKNKCTGIGLGRISARCESFARLRRLHTCRRIIILVETHASNINKLLVPKPRRTSCMSIDIEEYPAKYQVGFSINHPHELVLTSIGAHASLQSPRQIAL